MQCNNNGYQYIYIYTHYMYMYNRNARRAVISDYSMFIGYTIRVLEKGKRKTGNILSAIAVTERYCL